MGQLTHLTMIKRRERREKKAKVRSLYSFLFLFSSRFFFGWHENLFKLEERRDERSEKMSLRFHHHHLPFFLSERERGATTV